MERPRPPTVRSPIHRPAILRDHRPWIALLAAIALAFRIIHLGADGLWADEVYTVRFSEAPIGQILAGNDADHPPLYYLAEHMAMSAWGRTDFALRLLSALAGALTIPLVYVIGRRLARRRVGLWAAALVAGAPFHVRYSQEARGYGLQVALLTAGTACLLMALRRRPHRYRWWIGFGVAAAGSVYVLYSSFLVLAAQMLFVALVLLTDWARRRRTLGGVLHAGAGLAIGGLVAVALYSPWLARAVQSTTANTRPEHAFAVQWRDVPIRAWVAASYDAFGYMRPGLAAVVGALVVVGLAGAVARRRYGAALWVATGLCVPILAITLLGVSRAPLPKYVLFVLVVYLVGAAMGLGELASLAGRKRIAGRPSAGHAMTATSASATPVSATSVSATSVVVDVAVALALVALSVPAVRAEHAYVYNDWKGVLDHVRPLAREGDVIVPITLDLENAFNQGHIVLSHYLPNQTPGLRLLMGEHLADERVSDLSALDRPGADVWVTLLHRFQPLAFDPATVDVTVFQNHIYLVHPRQPAETPLQALIELYPAILPQAHTDATRCRLSLDLAVLHIRAGQFEQARLARDGATGTCQGTEITRATVDRLLGYSIP